MQSELAILPSRNASLATAGVLTLVVIPFALVMAQAAGLLVSVGMIMLVGAIAVTWFDRDMSKYIKLFVVASAAHCLIGYWLAAPTTTAIWIGTASQNFYERSFAVIASGLFCCCVTMIAATKAGHDQWLMIPLQRVSIDEHKLAKVAGVMTVLGAILIVFVYMQLGFLPILSGKMGVARYFTESMSENYKIDEWVVNRGADLLVYSVPIIFCFGLWTKRRSYLALSIFGFIALILPLRRSMVISVACMFLIMQSLRSGIVRKRYVAFLLLLIILYAGSQLLFLGAIGGAGMDSEYAVSAAGSALPEVRDLGWVMSLTDGHLYWGTTFVQSLVPIPSFLSDFSQRNSLRNITTKLIGLDNEETTGGLRLTLAGEGYVNFGYLGATIVGAGLGFILAGVDRMLKHNLKSLQDLFIISQVSTWLCVWVYLAGTQAAATMKVGIALTVLMLYLSRNKTPQTLLSDSVTPIR